MAWERIKQFKQWVSVDEMEHPDHWADEYPEYDNDQLDRYHNFMGEYFMNCEVDLDSGQVRIIGFQGQKLDEPIVSA